ncbi:hypothetical protein [Corynebacterium auriscanis]|uniref:phage tail tube protein n=1 Tax=Corynebacterium auriscanis TaxID=99807 RepID=UPI0006902F57|nr:hypothetical protein [Corynebacterium auriscanis]WJY73220.1 hypothetical protein CAURIC_08035 [Corynebacterium auriscanis]
MVDARNRKNVLVGAPDVKVVGGITVGAPVATADKFPTAVDADLKQTLQHKPAGYISEDGVTKTVDRSTEKIKDWNGDTIVITQSDHSVMLKTTFMEAANSDVLKLVAGEANVSEQGGVLKVVESAEELPHFSIGFTINGGNGSKILVFAPDAQVTEVGDVSYVKADVIKFEVTIECFGVDNQKLISMIKRAEEVGSSD